MRARIRSSKAKNGVRDNALAKDDDHSQDRSSNTHSRKIFIKRGSCTHRKVIQDIDNYEKYCDLLDAHIIFYDDSEPLIHPKQFYWSYSKPTPFLTEYKRLEQLGVEYSSNSAGDGPVYMLYTLVHESEQLILSQCIRKTKQKENKNEKSEK
jgi:hypothetical protein